MNALNFSENIIHLRHKRKITQGQLADFIGVTKASVSKWETRQSLPDILLLPQLAAFFDVTIDELLGYEPELSKEQIQKIYHELSAAFAELPFEEVMKTSQDYVKKYYSCYPFLFQTAILWLNHFMLAEGRERQAEVLTSISDLCRRIISNCRDFGICENASILNAAACLQLGNADEAIELLEELLNPARLSCQSDSILIQAYQLAGKKNQADSFSQISMYVNLLNLVSGATQHLAIHSDNLSVCEETVLRIKKVSEAYHLRYLHPNADALFSYQAAVVYCIHGKAKDALELLQQYADDVDYLLADGHLSLHGDEYFHQVQKWYEQLDLGPSAPRDKKTVYDSFKQSLKNPAFAALEQEPEFQKLLKSIHREEKNDE